MGPQPRPCVGGAAAPQRGLPLRLLVASGDQTLYCLDVNAVQSDSGAKPNRHSTAPLREYRAVLRCTALTRTAPCPSQSDSLRLDVARNQVVAGPKRYYSSYYPLVVQASRCARPKPT